MLVLNRSSMLARRAPISLAQLSPLTRSLHTTPALLSVRNPSGASPPHLLSLADLTVPQIRSIVERAAELKAMSRASDRAFAASPAAGKNEGGAVLPQSLKGKNVAIVFSKRSTRTRVASETSVSSLGESSACAGELDRGSKRTDWEVSYRRWTPALLEPGRHSAGRE